MSNTRVLVWTLAGVMTPDLASALAVAAGGNDVHQLKQEGAPAAKGPQGRKQLQEHLQQRLRVLAEQPVLVVHNASSVDLETNLAVAQSAAELGFRHLFVYFRNDARRMMLRMAARPALAALKIDTLIQRSRRGVEMLAVLKHHAALQGWPAFSLVAEDLQGPRDVALPPRLQPLLPWLGAAATEAAALNQLALARASFPDPRPEPGHERMAEVWRELALEPGVDARYVWLRPTLSVVAPAPSCVAALRVAPLPPYVVSGRELALTGALQLQPGMPEGWSLRLDVNGEPYLVDWDAGAAVGAPAGFDSGVLAVRGGMAMRLLLVSPQGEETTLATVDWAGPAHEPVSGILLGEYSLGYVNVPKAACTSIKLALMELGTGEKFDRWVLGTHVHRYLKDRRRDISVADFKFLVIRDPVKRFLSAYSNRVIHHRELSRKYVTQRAKRWKLSLDGFVFDPDLDTFLEHFTTYCKVAPILHHTRPVAHFVPKLAVFDKVYPMESLAQLQVDISEFTGREFVIGHAQIGGPKIGVDKLSLAQIEKLFALYRDDYALLKDFYTPEKLLAERARLLDNQTAP